jgi:hypothetical protein
MRLDFNLPRLLSWSKIQLSQHFNFISLFTLIFIGLSLIYWGIAAVNKIDNLSVEDLFFNQRLMFLMFVLIGGVLFTGRIFSNLSTANGQSLDLLLPVSNLEKILSAWLFSFVGWILWSSVVYEITINLFNLILSSFIENSEFKLFNLIEVLNNEEGNSIWYLSINAFFYHSLLLLGVSSFNKYSLAKAILLLIGVIIFFNLFVEAFLYLSLTGIEYRDTPEAFYFLLAEDGASKAQFYKSYDRVVFSLFALSVPLLLWPLTYHKLRTRQYR